MPWPTWDQAAIAAVASISAWFLLGRTSAARLKGALQPAFKEFALIAGQYSIWRIARLLPFTHESGALARARDIEQNFVGSAFETFDDFCRVDDFSFVRIDASTSHAATKLLQFLFFDVERQQSAFIFHHSADRQSFAPRTGASVDHSFARFRV